MELQIMFTFKLDDNNIKELRERYYNQLNDMNDNDIDNFNNFCDIFLENLFTDNMNEFNVWKWFYNCGYSDLYNLYYCYIKK